MLAAQGSIAGQGGIPLGIISRQTLINASGHYIMTKGIQQNNDAVFLNLENRAVTSNVARPYRIDKQTFAITTGPLYGDLYAHEHGIGVSATELILPENGTSNGSAAGVYFRRLNAANLNQIDRINVGANITDFNYLNSDINYGGGGILAVNDWGASWKQLLSNGALHSAWGQNYSYTPGDGEPCMIYDAVAGVIAFYIKTDTNVYRLPLNGGGIDSNISAFANLINAYGLIRDGSRGIALLEDGNKIGIKKWNDSIMVARKTLTGYYRRAKRIWYTNKGNLVVLMENSLSVVCVVILDMALNIIHSIEIPSFAINQANCATLYDRTYNRLYVLDSMESNASTRPYEFVIVGLGEY